MPRSPRHLFLVSVALLILLVVGGRPVQAQPEVPPLTGRIVDRADMLSPETERLLAAQLAAHEDSTGNQVAVLTVESLEGAPIEDYALEVARTWALGQEEFDNGVLLLVAEQDRKMRIEVGYGLEGPLPDAIASRIIRHELRPAFRQGDFDGGVRAGVSAILGAIEGTYTPPEGSSQDTPWPARIVGGLMFLFIPSLFAFMALLGSGCTRWFLFVFLCPFYFAAGSILTDAFTGGMTVLALYVVTFVGLQRHPTIQRWSEKVEAAAEKGEAATIGPFTISTGGSGGGFSSGGFGGGGGGFSGGGGSFGGGGASGGW